MHVTLRPSSHPELDPIVATGTLFAIGRQEPPFNSLDGALVSKLSRRHARLFEEGGCVYLADLGSLNGTTWNGEAVKHVPVALRTGDLVEFGGLTFEAEVTVDQPQPVASEAAVQRLVLTPERLKDTLEPIVVSSFPFLFDKTSDAFARHKGELRDVLAYMSRHHAHIFLRDDELYVEDLGSTNGTWVSGRKLDERARLLKDGDTIALGSDRLVYSVHLIRGAESSATRPPSVVEAVRNSTRTIFVDSPTSFLDVYFVGDRRSEPDSEEPAAENGADVAAAGRAPSGRTGLLRQLARTYFDGPLLGPSARRVLAGAVLATGAAGAIWYWQGRDVRAIESAMAREDYAVAVELALGHLTRRPDSPAIRDLAAQSAVRLWVPRWMSQIAAEDYDAAAATVDGAADQVGAHAELAEVTTMLGWTTRVRALLGGGRPGEDISALMQRAGEVSDLLAWWQGDSWSHARTLDRVAAVLPAFDATREQIYSDVRQLRLEGLDYRPLIDLDRRLGAALAASDLKAAGTVIDEFVTAHPQFRDRASLRRDLGRLVRLNEHIDAGRWLEGYRQLQEDPFTTALFAEHGRALGERALPDAATFARLEEARRRWRQGEPEAALAELDALAAGPWANLGTTLEQRYRQLLAGYEDLQASRGREDYASRLFAYYGTLDETEDSFLLAELEQVFRDHADAAVKRAAGYLAEAEAAWSAYQRSGGIQPEQRMEEQVSADFSALAGRLSAAVEALRRCQRIHRQVSQPLPEGWADLETRVSREVAFQRGQLKSLAFHEPEVQRQMLALLPAP